MDGNIADEYYSTMEVDTETVAMDTNEGGVTEAGEETSSVMQSDYKENDGELPVVPGPLGMVSQPLVSGDVEQCWQLPEGTCRKRLLVKGEGLRGPYVGSRCTVTLHLSEDLQHDLDPTLLGYPLGQSSVDMGEGGTPVSCLIDSALMSMKRGETAEVCLSSVKGIDREISLHVTLHDFTPVTPSWRLTPTEKCACAARHKEKGAQLFKDGNVYAAFAQFRTAVQLLLSVLPHSFLDDEAAEKSHQQLLCQCYLNLAACQMKTGHHRHVITNCTCALKIDPSNVKALYRRASANASLENYSEAKEDLKLGLQVEPNNRALLDLMRTVSVKAAQNPTVESGLTGLSKMFT